MSSLIDNKVSRGLVLGTSLFLGAGSIMAESSSANYAVPWDVLDGGGGGSSSANYAIQGSIAQAGPIGESSSAGYSVLAGFHSPPDSDADSVRNFLDNCIKVANTDQRNTNAGIGPGLDGFGNICDPDLNNDLRVDFADLAILKSVFFTTVNPDADLNGDGRADFADLAILKSMFFTEPGPSGLEP